MLVDTDFSAYLGNQGGSGSSDVPVVTFATFYITGWDGAPSQCVSTKNEPAPPNSDSKGNSCQPLGSLHLIRNQWRSERHQVRREFSHAVRCGTRALSKGRRRRWHTHRD